MIDVLPVHHDGERVGEVTSACFSPRLEKNIGYAMLPVRLTELGTQVEVDTPHGRAPATVVPKPFIDPTKAQPKQDVATLVGSASSGTSGT
jgi:glycine cleavage system aminomethyltransferase T